MLLKSPKVLEIFVIILLCGVAFCIPEICFTQSADKEEVVFTTYYPAPYAVYTEIRADAIAVGSGYRNSALNDGFLIVEEGARIGTPWIGGPSGNPFGLWMRGSSDVAGDVNKGTILLQEGKAGGHHFVIESRLLAEPVLVIRDAEESWPPNTDETHDRMLFTDSGKLIIGTQWPPRGTIDVKTINVNDAGLAIREPLNVTSTQPQILEFFPNLHENYRNKIVKEGDAGIIFSGGSASTGRNLVIAPWSTTAQGERGIRITDTGYVGIGIESPGSTLHVNGNLRVERALTFGGTPPTGGQKACHCVWGAGAATAATLIVPQSWDNCDAYCEEIATGSFKDKSCVFAGPPYWSRGKYGNLPNPNCGWDL